MNNYQMIHPATALTGDVCIPGDKSISHRTVMLAGLADQPVQVNNFLLADDCCSTIACMQALGVEIRRLDDSSIIIKGNGLHGLKEPYNILDAGNSGTTIRLLTGILAAQPFISIVTGDESLRQRPMGRVITPLTKMGANIRGRDNDRFAPLAVLPVSDLAGIEYNMSVASAQVKSAILLAGLFAKSPTTLIEPVQSRDHTELMMEAFGVKLQRNHNSVTLYPPAGLQAPTSFDVPGDISSAAFWLVAASVIPGSSLVLRNVGVNPSRTGIIDVLIGMGADIRLLNERLSGKEPVADIAVNYSQLRGIRIEGEIIPRLVDEIPILTVASLAAEGTTIIRGAGELRVKETDRLTAVTAEFSKMGAVIQESRDGLEIAGKQLLSFALCDSYHDHRIAMTMAVAGAFGQGAQIISADCVRISYPDFFEELNRLACCVGGRAS